MDTKIQLDLEKELALLENELVENDKFFDQVKSHYDKIIGSKSSGTLKFVTDQTSNVMNIRNSRINIIKEMINVKKLNAEMQLKELNLNKGADGSQDTIVKTAREIYNMMKSDTREGNVAQLLNKSGSSTNESNTVSSVDEQDNEAMLEERMRAIQAKKLEEKKDKDIKERGYIFACDMNGKVYAINKEGTEILEDIDIPDFEISFLEDELTGLITAKNQYGDVLDIIEVS